MPHAAAMLACHRTLEHTDIQACPLQSLILHTTCHLVPGFPVLGLALLAAVADFAAFATLQWCWQLANLTPTSLRCRILQCQHHGIYIASSTQHIMLLQC